MGKNVCLVPWSGGLDSTYMVYHLLKDGREVYPFFVIIENDFEFKSVQEYRAVRNMARWFEDEFTSLNPLHDVKISYYKHEGMGFGRDTDIIYNTALKMAYQLCQDDDIGKISLYEGLVWDDMQIKEFRRRNQDGHDLDLWRALVRTMYHRIPREEYYKVDISQVYYPLIDTTKVHLYRKLPAELLKMIWWCRNSRNGTHCGECNSCKVHKRVKYDAESM